VAYRDDREFLRGQVELLQDEADLGRSARERAKALEDELAEARQTIEHLELERVQAVLAAKVTGFREWLAKFLIVCSALLGVGIAMFVLTRKPPPKPDEDLTGYEPGCGPVSTVWPSQGPEGCHRLKCSAESLMTRRPGLICQECTLDLVTQHIEPGQPPRFACERHFPVGWTHRCDHQGHREASYEVWCRPE
jgi:hypothetical protein